MVKKSFLSLFILITLGIVLLDQLTKYLTRTYQPNWKIGFLSIHYLTNTGAAFSILQQYTFILALISLIVAIAIIISYKHLPSEKLLQILWALFLGGVIGNFLDRATLGFVIDFIDVGFWPAFNVADSALTIAAVGLVIYYWKK